MSDGPNESERRWVKPIVLGVLVVLAVYVLFTWVFPWVTEMGLSPTMG